MIEGGVVGQAAPWSVLSCARARLAALAPGLRIVAGVGVGACGAMLAPWHQSGASVSDWKLGFGFMWDIGKQAGQAPW